VLYDSSVPLNGMANMSFGLAERPISGQVNVFDYAVSLEDVGTRSAPKAQITVDSKRQMMEAFRDSMPSYRVSAAIETFTHPRSGLPLFKDTVPAFDQVVVAKAKITSRSGAVPFGGGSCDLKISPAYAQGDTCRVTLSCGGKIMYGAGDSGYNHCLVQDRHPTSFVDAEPTPTDTDPELQADLVAGTGSLSDTTTSGATYLVAFTVAH
jgi:hypothetical protein